MEIVVVGKDKSMLKKLEKYISSIFENGEIILFDDSKEAMQYIENNQIDVCFTEVVMSGVSGIAIAEELRKQEHKSFIAFLSDEVQYAMDAWYYKVNDFLLAPINYESIEHSYQGYLSWKN